MPQIGIRTFGYNRVRNSLRGLVVAHAQIIDPEVRAFAQDTRKVLKSTPYAPRPAESKYRRTGEVANKFAVDKKGTARYEIVNRSDHASYPIGDPQAYMHKPGFKGRVGWWKMVDIITKELPKLRSRIAKRLENL